MSERVEYRVALPDGSPSKDIFFPADEQPTTVHAFCVVVVNQQDGRRYTVHRSRLISIASPSPAPVPKKRRSVCFECGKVEGVVYDQVQCPHSGDSRCRLLEARQGG